MIRASRVGVVHGAFVLFAAVLVGRAAQVQVFQRGEWRAKARRQQVAIAALPAPRGRILDASGALLVESRQLVRLSIAPREVAASRTRRSSRDTRLSELSRALARAGVGAAVVRRATDTSRAWVTIPGHFLASEVAGLTAMRGVHAEPALERVPPATDGLRRLIGSADDAGEPVGGLEKSLDPVLRGEPGSALLQKDAKGRRFDSPAVLRREPRPGSTVTLTINQALQDIAERALGDAVTALRAAGGDIVMLDPNTGEVRAMASRRSDPLSTAATALTDPYEPGSTLKPFVAARLLDLGRAHVDEVVNTYDGRWTLNGRPIVDEHPAPWFSLADVIRFSSNIGIVQFAGRLSPREQYELLRDLGFGSPTGLPYPAEESGRLPSPWRWDSQTAASLAMGYALNVTPLQLVTAYAAIANGGELLEPAIVKEIRGHDGTVTYRHERRVVRRVMSPESAREVRRMLRGVVEGGTAASAGLATFDLAGKTSTAKRVVDGRYVAGRYTASFAGLFPAEDPQLVILVKLDDPSKSVYGGKAAAPVSRTVLQAAIAARAAALDRAHLVEGAGRPSRRAPDLARGRERAETNAGPASLVPVVRAAEAANVPYVRRLGAPPAPASPDTAARAVPDVRGLALRRAVAALHRAGFRVTLTPGSGAASGTFPAAGVAARAGSTVRLARAP